MADDFDNLMDDEHEVGARGEDQFVFIDSQLMGFGESDSSGCWGKFQMEKEDLAYLRGRKGMTTELYMRFRDASGNVVSPYSDAIVEQAKPKAPAKAKGEHGNFWRNCIKDGLFYNTELLQKISGTQHDDEWQEWCRHQPCIVTGGFDDTTNDKNVYAHILTAEAKTSGGTGAGSNKPIFQGVGMQQDWHSKQHSDGWLAIYKASRSSRGNPIEIDNEKDAIRWAMGIRSRNLVAWTGEKLSQIFEVESRSFISPTKWETWLKEQ